MNPGQHRTGKNKEPCDGTQRPLDSHVLLSPPIRDSLNAWEVSIFHATK
jgi:hypothetical protein